MMCGYKKIVILSTLFFFVLCAQGQFLISGTSASKKGTDQSNSESNRQRDIYLLEQKSKVIEQDVLSGNLSVFDKHKLDVLELMDREISRSAYDFSEMKEELRDIDPDSQEGRALRISIQQMDGRVNRQKFIRLKVADFSIDDIYYDNTKELSGLRSQYFQFIKSMKINLRDNKGVNLESGDKQINQGPQYQIHQK